MSLVGDKDGDGWIWLERLGFSGFQWGWVVVVEICVAMEIGVGLGFVFIGLFRSEERRVGKECVP